MFHYLSYSCLAAFEIGNTNYRLLGKCHIPYIMSCLILFSKSIAYMIKYSPTLSFVFLFVILDLSYLTCSDSQCTSRTLESPKDKFELFYTNYGI